MRGLPQRVYFIHVPQLKTVKIGYSTNPSRRLDEIRCCIPMAVMLLGSIPGGRSAETVLHDQFWPFRVQGEWFGDEIVPAVRGILEKYSLADYHFQTGNV